MRPALTRSESILLVACALLAAFAVFGPAIAQSPDTHAFADQRNLWGIPHALDVLSNLPFAVAGAWGLLLLQRAPAGALYDTQRACARPATGELLSGHTLKHVVAAFAAAPVLSVLAAHARGQNERPSAVQAA